MPDSQDKVYADGFLIKARDASFGQVLSVSIVAKDFKKFLDDNVNSNGWVKLDIKKKKTPSDKGYTHYAQLDTWEPSKDGGKGGSSKPAQKPAGKSKPSAPAASQDDDDIPF